MSLLKTNEIQNYNGSSLTLTASTVSTSAQLNTGGNISVTGSLNVSDDSTTRTNLGLGSMATQNANAVAITGGTINTVQPATGQSLTIKDEDGNTAITIGTDNTAAGYLSLNFGSYHGDSGGAGGGSLSGNTLDDYETGTWTPVLQGSSTAGTYTYEAGRTLGTYTKIGNTVFLSGSLRVSGVTSAGTGNARIAGLPFASSSANQGNYPRRPHPVLLQGGATLSSSSIFSGVEDGSSYLTLYTQSTSDIAAVSVTDADYLNSIWAFSVVYKVS